MSPRATPTSPDLIPAIKFRDRDRYQILGEHGRGGLGRVSRAHDHDLGRDIAIKELISRGHVSELRFLREALITARLEHPGIVPLYEAGRWPDGTPFYAMKLVAGRPLRALIGERRTVEGRLGLLHHVIAVADAIAYAHGRNIVHRDLKPANVIVGDFGETVVIDWGLAKDLSAAEESSVGGRPFRSQRDEGLTSTGSVLGTPSYMAPEQERGEPVDQRADVFAIGAMLWELCSLDRLPPGYTGQRGRILRRASIDPDLATIILKALQPDPKHRYPDAGALAADLKAFKAGARIAARRYSLFGLLAHWTRRHRALAVSLATALVVSIAGIATYVRHISVERDRVAAANNALILKHAELLLHSDPTAAFDVVRTYGGSELIRRDMLAAEARGLGVATLRTSPQTQKIYWMDRLTDGTLATLSADGTIAKITPAGSTHTIASDAVAPYAVTRAPGRILAYTCEHAAICILDLENERMRPSPAIAATFTPRALALSPSGALLAAISSQGELSIWQVAETGSPVLRFQAAVDREESLKFIDERTLTTHARDDVRIFHLDAEARLLSRPAKFSLADCSELNVSSDHHLVTVSTTRGELVIIDSEREEILGSPSLCKGYLNKTFIVAARPMIEYSCQDGDVGIFDLDGRTSQVLAHLDGGSSVVSGSADGRLVIAGGNNGKLLLHDLTTHIQTIYQGHASRPTVLLAPSPDFANIVSGDAGGQVRVWPVPASAIHVAVTTSARLLSSLLLPANDTVIAVSNGPTIPWRAGDGSSGELSGHNARNTEIAASSALPRFVLFGSGDELELWSFGSLPARRTAKTGHGTVEDIAYLPDGIHFVVGSHDGTVIEWSADGDTQRELGSIHEPVAFLRVLWSTGAIVIGGTSGALWRCDGGSFTYIGKETGTITAVAASDDSRWLAIGTARGMVDLYGLANRQLIRIQSPQRRNEFLAFSSDGTTLAVATGTSVSLVTLPAATAPSFAAGPGRPSWAWSDVELVSRHVTISRDDQWFAATDDHGGIWFNHRGSSHWAYVATGTTRISSGYFSRDSTRFLATDSNGRALIVDMHSNIFASPQPSITSREYETE